MNISTLADELMPAILRRLDAVGIRAASGGSAARMPTHDLFSTFHNGTLDRTQAPWVATDINTAIGNHVAAPDPHPAYVLASGARIGATSQAQEFSLGAIINGANLTASGLVARSLRTSVVAGNVVGGLDIWSNDTSLTAPGQLVAGLRAVATATHTTTQLGTDLAFYTTMNAQLIEAARLSSRGILTTGWLRNAMVGIGGSGTADDGMSGIFDRNELTIADLRGVVTVTITGAGTVSAGTGGNMLNARGGFTTIAGTDATTTQIRVHIDLLAIQPNYASALWQPFLLYRLGWTSTSGSKYRNIVVEVSSNNTDWYKPASGAWETTDGGANEIVTGLWMGATANPAIPGNAFRYVRFTLTDRVVGATNADQIWINQIGLRHRAAPYSRAYLYAGGDGTLYGNLTVTGTVKAALATDSVHNFGHAAIGTPPGGLTNTAAFGHRSAYTNAKFALLAFGDGNTVLNGESAMYFYTAGVSERMRITPTTTQHPNNQIQRSTTFDSGFPIQGYQLREDPDVLGKSILTIGSITADELFLKVFVADEVRVRRGQQFWTYSNGIVAANFTTPTAIGLSTTILVENSPAFPGNVFVSGDWIMIQYIDRTGGGLTATYIWGQVYTPLLPPITGADTQAWTFTLRSGPTNTLVKKGSEIVDFGVSGAALIHLSVVDASGRPWIKLRKWAGADPISPANYTTYVQIGSLDGLGLPDYSPVGAGIYIRPSSSDRKYIIVDDNDVRLNRVWLRMYEGLVNTAILSDTGDLQLGTNLSSPATTTFDFNHLMGSLRLGPLAAGQPNLYFDGADLHLRNFNTPVITLSNSGNSFFAGIMTIGTAGEIRQGSGTLGTNYTGLRIWNDGGLGRIGGYNNNVLQFYANTDGKLYAGAGNVQLHANGIDLQQDGFVTPDGARAISWWQNIATQTGVEPTQTIRAFFNGLNQNVLQLEARGQGGAFTASRVDLTATTSAGVSKSATLYSDGLVALPGALSVIESATINGALAVGEAYALASGGISAGRVAVDYSPTAGNWNTTGSTLLLNGLNFTTIGFHDSGSRVDFIRAGGGLITIGYDGGFGPANVAVGGTLRTALNIPWNLGGYTAGAPAATGYISVVVNGVTYKLLAST